MKRWKKKKRKKKIEHIQIGPAFAADFLPPKMCVRLAK